MNTNKHIPHTLLIICLLLSFSATNAQQKEKKYKSFNQILEEAEYINGRYIPYDINDALKVVDTLWDDEKKNYLREYKSNDFFADFDLEGSMMLHKGIGWRVTCDGRGPGLELYFIRNFATSRFVKYLKKQGLSGNIDESDAFFSLAFQANARGEELDIKQSLYEIRRRQLFLKGSGVMATRFSLIKARKKGFARRGLCVGNRVYFKYIYGSNNEDEVKAINDEKRYKKAVATGIIIKVNYLNLSYLVKVTKTFSPEGIIVYDPMVDVEQRKEKFINKHDNCIFLKEGDKMWFNHSDYNSHYNQWHAF